MSGKFAAVVSVVSLLVAGGSLYYAHDQANNTNQSIQTQQKQLDQQREAFSASQPKTSATAYLNIYDTAANKWLNNPVKGSTIDPLLVAQSANRSMDAYFYLKNEGATSDSILDAGIYTSPSQKVSSVDALCYIDDGKNRSTSECHFPVSLDSNERLQMWFVMKPEMLAGLTCNQYAQAGTMVYYVTRSQGEQRINTEVAVPTAGFCQQIATQPQK